MNRISNERVEVNEGGRRKTISKLDAALKQLANKAATGDLRAIPLLVDWFSKAQACLASSVPADAALPEDDLKVLRGFYKRMSASKSGDDDDN